jgi:hypothetical protein
VPRKPDAVRDLAFDGTPCRFLRAFQAAQGCDVRALGPELGAYALVKRTTEAASEFLTKNAAKPHLQG